LKRKMRELTKTEEGEEGARGQRLRTSNRERRDTSGSDREGRRADQGEIRARSKMQTVDNLIGKSLVPEGQDRANERGETIVKPEPLSARSKSKLMSARKSSREERKSKKVKIKVPDRKVVIKKEKLTESESEKREDKPKKVEKRKSKKYKKESSSE